MFVANGDRIHVCLILQLLFPCVGVERIGLGLQEARPGKQKGDPGSELWVDQDWSLGLLVCKTGRRKGSFNASKASFTFPFLQSLWLCVSTLFSPIPPPSCLLLWKHALRVLPLSFYSHLSFFNSFLNSPPAIYFNIVLWIHSLHFCSQNHP